MVYLFLSSKMEIVFIYMDIVLTILIIIMILKFYNKDKVAGLLQIPYLLWVLFASYLNIAIYILNK